MLEPEEQAHASAAWLYEEAPLCLLAHNTEADPVFIYGNRAAQRCFEYDWATLITLRSRQSADGGNHAHRAELFDVVRTHGFATGYRGLRVARSGRRFWIENVTVWNLIDDAGVPQGQAALFRQWTPA